MDYLFYSPESKLFGLTIFVSIVLFQMAFIMLQWIFERRNDYLFYASYMMLSLCYGVIEFGEYLPFYWFKETLPVWKVSATHTLPAVSVYLYYRFARSFLNLPVTRPELNIWVVRLEYFILSFVVLIIILQLSGISQSSQFTIFNTGTAFIVISSAVIILSFLKQSDALSRIAMLGTGFLLAGSAITFSLLIYERSGGILYFDPYLPLLIFVIAELLTFTTGLNFKTRLLEKQKLQTETALLKEFQKRQVLEKQMYEVRESIARDLHDEIGSGLSKISFLGEIIKKDGAVTNSNLDKIICSAKDMVKALGEMIWTLNTKNDKLESSIYFFRRHILEYCDNFPVTLNVEVPNEIPECEISGIQRRNIMLVMKEAINNSLKHSGCTRINVKFEVRRNKLHITIHDDGKGLSAARTGSFSGNGMKNMQSRMKEVNGKFEIQNQEGTRVNLDVPLSDVNL